METTEMGDYVPLQHGHNDNYDVYDYLVDVSDAERSMILRMRLFYAFDRVLYYSNTDAVDVEIMDSHVAPYESITPKVPVDFRYVALYTDTDRFVEPKDLFISSPFSIDYINHQGIFWLSSRSGVGMLLPNSTVTDLLRLSDIYSFKVYVLGGDD